MTSLTEQPIMNRDIIKEVDFHVVGQDVAQFKNDPMIGPIFVAMRQLASMAATKPTELERIRLALGPAKGDVFCDLLKELIVGIQKATEASKKDVKKAAPKTNVQGWSQSPALNTFQQSSFTRKMPDISDPISPRKDISRQSSGASMTSPSPLQQPMMMHQPHMMPSRNPYSPVVAHKPKDMGEDFLGDPL